MKLIRIFYIYYLIYAGVCFALRISSDNISFINIENKTPFLLSTATSLLLSSQLRRLVAPRKLFFSQKTGFPADTLAEQCAICEFAVWLFVYGRAAKYQLGTQKKTGSAAGSWRISRVYMNGMQVQLLLFKKASQQRPLLKRKRVWHQKQTLSTLGALKLTNIHSVKFLCGPILVC